MIQSLSLHIPTTAAGTPDTWYIASPFPGTWKIVKCYFAPATAVAAAATDYTTVTVATNASTASTSWTSLGSFNTNAGATALVLGTVVEIAMSAAPASLEITPGRQIRIDKTDTASGDILDGTFSFLLEKIS